MTSFEEPCVKLADWEINFAALKSKRRETGKLPDFYKIDCFLISANSFKSAIEDLRRLKMPSFFLCARASLGS